MGEGAQDIDLAVLTALLKGMRLLVMGLCSDWDDFSNYTRIIHCAVLVKRGRTYITITY